MCTQWLPIVCLPFLKLHFLLLKALVCVQAMSSVRIGVESDFNKITPKLLIQASTFLQEEMLSWMKALMPSYVESTFENVSPQVC